MVDSKLTGFQEEILREFFRREARFFLTGGAALAGYHLGHRQTQDLDLFATAGILDEGDAALRSAADFLGATIENLRTSPDFRRRLVRRGAEGVVVDLVFDRAPQGVLEKLTFGNVRVDPPGEILANKLCTLLARAELRDLVDVIALERSGLAIERALPLATRKDGGLTPAQLAWVLSQISIGEDAVIPGGVSLNEVRDFLQGLQVRLTRLGFPS